VDKLNVVRAVSELIDGGGPFVGWIFVCGIVLWTISIERFWFYRRILPGMADAMLAEWMARRDHTSWCARQIRDMMISKLKAAMTANLQILNVLVPLSPLLGLIGTVSGMLEVFDSMALRGSADARTMASGVSHAMICTLTGLAVSISGLYPQYYFRSESRRRAELLSDRFTF
jgi:biopolymer transport protein ExbB